jgi:hypothetical protein
MSRRSVLLVLACAALAFVAAVWLTRDAVTSSARASAPLDLSPSHPLASSSTPLELDADEKPSAREVAIVPEEEPAPEVESTPSFGIATVVVHVVSKETGEPVSSLHVGLWPKSAAPSYYVIETDRSVGTVELSLRPRRDGTAEFTNVPSGRVFLAYAQDDRQVARFAECELRPLETGERRDVRIEIPTRGE